MSATARVESSLKSSGRVRPDTATKAADEFVVVIDSVTMGNGAEQLGKNLKSITTIEKSSALLLNGCALLFL